MANFTEKAMAASLKKLLEKKTLDKITIKDITEDCGVNRQTFYYHFHDIYELMEWSFTERARAFTEAHADGNDWKQMILDLIEKLSEEKAFILNTFNSVSRRQLEFFLHSLVKPILQDITETFSEGLTISEQDKEFVIDIFSFGFIGIMTEWVADGMKQNYGEDIDRFFLLLDGTLRGTLEKFSK